MNAFEVGCVNCSAPLQRENGVFQNCAYCGTKPDEEWIRKEQRLKLTAEYEAAYEVAKAESIPKAHPDLKCPECGSVLHYTDSGYESCRVCNFMPCDLWVRKHLYLSDSQRPAAELKHDFASDEFVFEHPVGSAIPAGSAIIVTEHQTAAYRTGGRYKRLEGPLVLPVSLDNRTNAERLQAITKGEQESIWLAVNTKLLFFDCRWKQVIMCPTVQIFGTVWKVTPELHFMMRITDPEALLNIAVTLTGGSDLADYLRKQVDLAVENAFSNTLAANYIRGVLTRNTTVGNAQVLVRDFLDRELVEIVKNINAPLQQNGVKITAHPGSFIRWNTLVVTNTDTTVEHRCPNRIEKDGVVQPCSGSKRLPTGDHRRWVCPVCGATVRWCDSCNGYKHFDEADSESPNRFCRSCGKSNYN